MKPSTVRTGTDTPFLLNGALIAAILLCIGGTLLMASVPPVSRDALTHHLALPKLFLKHGGLVAFPGIPFSYYPMNLDLLYTAVLATGNDILPKYVHWLFGLLTAGLVYRYLSRRISRSAGLLGALLWLSLPIVVRLSSEVYVDLGLGFFSTAGLCALIRWSETEDGIRHLVWAGLWCGLALGTKYNAMLTLVVMVVMIPFIYIRIKGGRRTPSGGQQAVNSFLSGTARENSADHNGYRGLLYACFFAIVAVAVFSPWAVRNVVLKGNPVYPMMNNLFKAGDSNLSKEWSQTSSMVQDTASTVVTRRIVFKESFGYMALMPLRIFFEGKDGDPRRFDGKLNPFLPLLILGALATLRFDSGRLGTERWIWFFYVVLFMALAFFLAPIRIRYLLPVLPALIILAILGVFNLKAWIEVIPFPWLRRASAVTLVGIVMIALIFNAVYSVQRLHKLEPWAFLSGKVTRDAYIAKRRPEYPLIQFINSKRPAAARILALFLGERRYYFDREVTFNEGLFLEAVKRAKRPEDIDEFLKGRGITDILVRMDLFQKWLPHNLTEEEIDRFKTFWSTSIHNVASQGIYRLFTIDG